MQKPSCCSVTPLRLFLSWNARIERQFAAYTHTQRSIAVLVSSHFCLHTTQSLFTGTSAKRSKATYIYNNSTDCKYLRMCRVRAIYQNKLACCVTGLSGCGLFKHCVRIIQAALETNLSGAKLASIESARMRS